jgi:hypothetical protein
VPTYDIFEKFRDGGCIWRACVAGKYELERKLQELAEHSENEFFMVDLLSQSLFRLPCPQETPTKPQSRINTPPRSIGQKVWVRSN